PGDRLPRCGAGDDRHWRPAAGDDRVALARRSAAPPRPRERRLRSCTQRQHQRSETMIPTELFDLSGKVALLTGASRGMGKAMAQALAEHGARVMVSSRKLDACQAVADEINAKLGEQRAFAVACNAGYKDQLQALVDGTHHALGPIDALVGN